jgi:hypothetical protein
MQRLRKIALDSDYGDAKPILARAQERGQGYVAMVKSSKAKS